MQQPSNMNTTVFQHPTGRFVEEDIITRITDQEEFDRCQAGLQMADCACDSLDLWVRLRKTGIIRVRGKRQHERDADQAQNTTNNYHYWCYIKEKVWNAHGGVLQIVPKHVFYEDITDTTEGEYGGVMDCELTLIPEEERRLFRRILDTGEDNFNWRGFAESYRVAGAANLDRGRSRQ